MVQVGYDVALTRRKSRVQIPVDPSPLMWLKNVLPEKDILRNLDTLIGTQRVRRIGSEILQNNQSHTELPDLPEHLKSLLEKI